MKIVVKLFTPRAYARVLVGDRRLHVVMWLTQHKISLGIFYSISKLIFKVAKIKD